jgi:hypothetical protein
MTTQSVRPQRQESRTQKSCHTLPLSLRTNETVLPALYSKTEGAVKAVRLTKVRVRKFKSIDDSRVDEGA